MLPRHGAWAIEAVQHVAALLENVAAAAARRKREETVKYSPQSRQLQKVRQVVSQQSYIV